MSGAPTVSKVRKLAGQAASFALALWILFTGFFFFIRFTSVFYAENKDVIDRFLSL